MMDLIKNKVAYLTVECQQVIVNLELTSAQAKWGERRGMLTRIAKLATTLVSSSKDEAILYRPARTQDIPFTYYTRTEYPSGG
jgi:hypothetical protein